MVKLFCSIVGVAGNAFPVIIDAGESVGDLKKAIKAEKPNDFETIDADKLQLFLAKTESGAWLTEADVKNGVKDTSGLKLLGVARARLRRVGLSDTDVGGVDEEEEAEGKGPVNVLVVVPSSKERAFTVTETMDEAALEELERYRLQGDHIKVECTTYCNNILNKIDEYYGDTIDKIDKSYDGTIDTLPFLCVAGSSGMGKSQLAFALSGRRPYFYWLGMRVTPVEQLLYQNFKNISEAFIRCVELDNPNKAEEQLVLDTSSQFYRNEFWTYGLIRALLVSRLETGKMVHFGGPTTLRVEKCDLAAVRAVVAKLKEKEKKTGSRLLPFFILDEMAPDSSGGKNAAAFQRNVFRVCGLVVMLMGTDTKITNLVNHARSSYTRRHQWMTVVSRFPSFQLKFFATTEKEIWQRIVEQYPVVETIVLRSRGRFSRYFIDEVFQKFQQDPSIVLCELLDAACARVSEASHDGKKFMNSPEGMCNQLMAISYTNAIGDVDMSVAIAAANPSIVGEPAQKKRRVHLKTPGMHKHFANLVDENVTDVMVSDALLEIKDPYWRKWQPMCSFTSIEGDLLLYLAILGGKKYPSYYNPSERMHHSTKHIFSTTNPNEYVVHENTSAPTLDFKRYENMVAHAMFSSSRRNGVRGISFRDFLSCFLGEFEDTIWMKVAVLLNTESTHQLVNAIDLLEGYHDSVGALADRTVPFLAPPNTKWPSYIIATNADNCKFGRLVRPPNEERCDVYVVDLEEDQEKAMFVCECKYRDDKVNSGVINDILLGLNARWGESWKVVIVFCTEVTSFRTWKSDTIGCVKIKRGKDPGTAIANWIFQPELEKRKKLMIIVETGLITASAS